MKYPPESFAGAEAAAAGDRFERIGALNQCPLCCLGPHPFHIFAGTNADLTNESAM